MPQLQRLDISHTQVTDAGLGHLKGLTQLDALWLNGTQVTDAGLNASRAWPNSKGAGLAATQVTDAGLECLKGLTRLEKDFSLYADQVTDEGVTRLRRALPNCQMIHRDDRP